MTYKIIQFPVDKNGTVWKSGLLEARNKQEIVQAVIAGYAQGQTRLAVLVESTDIGTKGKIVHAIGTKGEPIFFPESITITA